MSDALQRLQAGDEAAFSELVEELHPALVRAALAYVPSRAVAEEVAQETWLGVLKGLPSFEGRSSLKTWIFTILANRARTRGQRESRVVPSEGLSVEPERFEDHSWSNPPRPWTDPERRLESTEAREVIFAAIRELPERQRTAIVLRDAEGLSSGEVCNALNVTETNQRVLLHRARSKVRAALEDYMEND